jgi:G3E family GTPase
MSGARIPATIITGFLGSGKTTLLNRILQERHGHRIAVIENEFGEAGIDNEILLQHGDEQIIEMNNGCICCTVRGDLVRILGDLADRRRAGALDFERVVIETTGLADPGPVAQTFFADENVARDYALDAIITVVDAVHAPRQLDAHHEAQEQVGFADRLLLTKADLVSEDQIGDILDIGGFDLDAMLGVDPHFLESTTHAHDGGVSAFVCRERRPYVQEKLELFLGLLIETYGADMLRYKGVLNIEDRDRRVIFQGVHMLMGADDGKPWSARETRESVMVFIGRRLPRALFERGLALCVAGATDDPASVMRT